MRENMVRDGRAHWKLARKNARAYVKFIRLRCVGGREREPGARIKREFKETDASRDVYYCRRSSKWRRSSRAIVVDHLSAQHTPRLLIFMNIASNVKPVAFIARRYDAAGSDRWTLCNKFM